MAGPITQEQAVPDWPGMTGPQAAAGATSSAGNQHHYPESLRPAGGTAQSRAYGSAPVAGRQDSTDWPPPALSCPSPPTIAAMSVVLVTAGASLTGPACRGSLPLGEPATILPSENIDGGSGFFCCGLNLLFGDFHESFRKSWVLQALASVLTFTSSGLRDIKDIGRSPRGRRGPRTGRAANPSLAEDSSTSRHDDHREAGLPSKRDRHAERQSMITAHDDHNRPGRSTLVGDR